MEQNMKDLKEKLQPLSDKLDPTVAAFIDTVMENDDIETLKTITTSISTIINSTTDRQRISRIAASDEWIKRWDMKNTINAIAAKDMPHIREVTCDV